ncbi:MAG: alkaline phosphatase D family protein [Actinomycetia bacterium]|nr:alkaline phosphatase D family protein [Actinomycetes bacterium]
MTPISRDAISRRMFLAGAAAVAVTACSDDSTPSAPTTSTNAAPTKPSSTTASTTTTSATTLPSIELAADPFTLGVASGDPDTDSVVLWTRLAPLPLEGGGMPADDVPVLWEASATDDFASIAASGQEVAKADSGHSVHAFAELPQGTWFYRFRVGQYTSPTGITRVAPTDATEVRFAAASCQHYEAGYYAAHRDLAEHAPDFTLWLGDYIYEDAGTVGGDPAARIHLDAEPTTLEQYRNRYARYKTDANLQAAHASCPWFVIWDDHEVENNYAGLLPQEPDDLSEFEARRFAAYTAWWEHQPVRLPPPAAAGEEYRIYRDATWGELLTLVLLDGRQYRSDQACGDAVLDLEPACAEAADPSRTMLGDAQEQWLVDTLTDSSAQWNVIGNQVVMANATLNGAVLNYDQWDGYPVARERLLASLDTAGIQNLIVVTGDIHLAAVAHLRTDDAAVGVEFVTTSISSGANLDPQLTDLLKSFPDLVDAELAHRGYTLHTVTPDLWTAEYRVVTDVASLDSEVTTYSTYVVESGSNTVAPAP